MEGNTDRLTRLIQEAWAEFALGADMSRQAASHIAQALLGDDWVRLGAADLDAIAFKLNADRFGVSWRPEDVVPVLAAAFGKDTSDG